MPMPFDSRGRYAPPAAERQARKLTLDDITDWVNNDEGLYNWWRSCKQPQRKFVRENRVEPTRLINQALNRGPIR